MIVVEKDIKFGKEKSKNKLQDTNDLGTLPISQDIIYMIIRYLPTTIIDDEQERKEQVIKVNRLSFIDNILDSVNIAFKN